MNLGIEGRVAVIGGSTSGLGEGIARALANEGVRVVVAGRRGERAVEIARELPDAIGIGIDITAADAADVLVAAAEKAFGPVDIAVLNGGGPAPSVATDLADQQIIDAMNTLLLPHKRLVNKVLGGMRERKWGRILAVGSSGVESPIPGLATSNMGRAALAGYLKTLASEVGRDGVTVNMMLPGRIFTDRIVELDTARAKKLGVPVEEVYAETKADIPLGRFGRPDEFGEVGAFLCSEQAGYITGTTLRCDGGRASFL